MEDQLTDYTKATVEGAVKGVVESLGPFLKSIAELITDFFDRKETKRKELAEVFASHLEKFAALLSKSADKLEQEIGVPGECAMLQALAEGLDKEVVAKVLKDEAKREKILKTAIEAARVGLMDVKAMQRVYRLNRTEFWVGMIALLGVLTFGTLQGVLMGLLLSLLVLIARSAMPNIPVLGRSPGSDVFHSLDQYPDSETYPGLVIIRFDGPLYFATAHALRDKVRAVATETTPPVTMVLIDMEGVNYLDLEGSDMLKEITENMKGAGVEIHLARLKHEVMEMIERDGVDQTIGRDHIHSKVFEAVQWFNQKEKPVSENNQ